MTIRASLAATAGDVVAILRTRLEIFGAELSEEKSRAMVLVGMALAGMFFLALALLVFTLWIAVLFWPTEYRYWALAGLALIYALAGLVLLLVVRHRLMNDPPAFEVTVEELGRDARMFSALAAHTSHVPGSQDESASGLNGQKDLP